MNSPSKNWRLFLASATGTAHLARGRPCDDSSTYFEFSDGSWLGIVADGAGSAKFACDGSAIAVQEASRFMRDRLTEVSRLDDTTFIAAIRDGIHQIHEALSKFAAARSASISDFATTLLMICVTPNVIAAAQIGDGGIVVRQSDGDLSLLFPPNRGEYVNETHFITSNDFAETLRINVIPRADIDGIAVFTDGIEFLAIDLAKKLPHAPFFRPLFDFAASADAKAEELQKFLVSQPVCDRTDDDKTLLIAVLA